MFALRPFPRLRVERGSAGRQAGAVSIPTEITANPLPSRGGSNSRSSKEEVARCWGLSGYRKFPASEEPSGEGTGTAAPGVSAASSRSTNLTQPVCVALGFLRRSAFGRTRRWLRLFFTTRACGVYYIIFVIGIFICNGKGKLTAVLRIFTLARMLIWVV